MALLFDYCCPFSSVQHYFTVASHCACSVTRSVRPTAVFSVEECCFAEYMYLRIWVIFSGSELPWPSAPFNFSRVTSCSEVLRLGAGAHSSVFRICHPWRRFPCRSCLPIVKAPKWMSPAPNLHVAM